MNSSLDGDSPISTPSSPSPPPEELQFSSHAHQPGPAAQLLERIMGGPSGGKRRLTGSSGTSGHGAHRDPKTRRRGEASSRNPNAQGSGNFDYPPAQREEGRRAARDELVDSSMVEYLRREIGDPFQEGTIKALNREE